MIHVNRSKTVPDAFKSKEILRDKKLYEEFYRQPFEKRAQLRVRSKNTVGDTIGTINAVAVQFKYKCAFCETSLHKDRIVVDSFRPRVNARGLHKDSSQDHYWWLSYEWRNKYAICRDCNEYKATWFPVKGKRAAIKTPYLGIIKTEDSLLIDPCNDYPEEHLHYNNDGKAVSRTEKGEVTIEILKLNRTNLVHKRKEAIEDILDIILKAQNAWKKYNRTKLFTTSQTEKLADLFSFLKNYLLPHPEEEFIAVKRQYVIEFLHNNPDMLAHMDFWRKYSRGQDSQALKEIHECIKFFSDVFDIKKQTQFTYKTSFITGESNVQKKVAAVKKAAPKKAASTSRQTTSEQSSTIQPQQIAPAHVNKQISDSIQANWNYPERIEISNFKSIHSLEIKFITQNNDLINPVTASSPNLSTTEVGKPWKLLLGENGVGKSSILQAIALALAGNDYIKQLNPNPNEILTHGTKSGHVRIYMVGSDEPIELKYTGGKNGYIKSTLNHSKINLLGYGSTRMLPKGNILKPESVSGTVRVKNLFDYSVSLVDVNKWLMQIDKKTFDRVGLALKDLLNLPEDDHYFIKGRNGIYFSKRKETLYELSEGYRSVIALAIDIMKSLSKENSAYDVAEGIVLIDEISSHLHPRWQMRIVRAFRKCFPKLYFIVCSHDPLSLKGLRENEVLLLKRDSDDNVIGIDNLPNPSEHTAEQLLTSEFFGLNSTIDPDLEMKFNTYHYLLSKDKRTKTEEEQLLSFRELLKPKIHLGNTLREELFYNIIDASLQENKVNNYNTSRADLVKDVKAKANGLMEKLNKN